MNRLISIIMLVGLFLLAVAARGADAEDRFKGGSYDGWGQATTELASLSPPPTGTIFKVH